MKSALQEISFKPLKKKERKIEAEWRTLSRNNKILLVKKGKGDPVIKCHQ